MTIDHIGIAVQNLEEGIRHWREFFGYVQVSPIVFNSRQQTKVVFLAKPDSITIKLIEPSSTASPVAGFSRRGGGLHHLCFRCEQLDAAIPQLKRCGARFLVPPEPGEAFCGNRIAFFLAPGNLNIELIDTEEKHLLAESSQER